jgi:hypothetical protein
MDWMNAQLRELIAQGQRALGKEVVVLQDGVEDNGEGIVDDGAEGWMEEEEEEDAFVSRKRQRQGLRPPPISSTSTSSIPAQISPFRAIFSSRAPPTPTPAPQFQPTSYAQTHSTPIPHAPKPSAPSPPSVTTFTYQLDKFNAGAKSSRESLLHF